MTQTQDDYRFRAAGPEEAEAFHRLMREVWRGMEDRELFAVDDLDRDWIAARMTGGGFGVAACTPAGEMAGMLLVSIPGLGEDNLGYDVGMAEDRLPQVGVVEIAAVLPRHRGHGLERRMMAWAEDRLAGSEIRCLMATISPRNPASLRSAERCGYRVILTKEKYGGHLRHILMKPINGGRWSDLTIQE